MLMVSILQSKDIDWQIGLKNNIQPFIAYEKCAILVKTNIKLE
jgi:hypothetical protein